ncbi:arylsulfatase [Bacteroides gallinarum]|uniref:arylsulfatase n=1 Tax=Bacteroides gallinarum TaxID=376806 RepID=UPI00046ABD09|nr:arylsulfatase [Bacteroides gallinarum]
MKIINCFFSITAVLSGNIFAQEAKSLPNVIYIMADDLGIGDLGCYGQRQIKTPNIDGIAQHGMKFMQHYAGSTVSAPSRCALLTGKHMGHAAIRGNKKVPGDDGLAYETPLPHEEITVADIFKKRGYMTACIGKWGLGGPGTEGIPGKHGFDYFYGYLGQGFAHSYYPDFLHENDKKIELNGNAYSHDLMLSKSLGFIEQNKQTAFFLYYSPTIPHADLDIMEEQKQEYKGLFCETPFTGRGYKQQLTPRTTYAAMVTYLDKSVGMIIDKLKELDLYDNTIVVFTSDNGVHAEGGHDPYFFDSNGPFRGYKRDLYEGGVRTPFVIQWPEVIPQGAVTDHISAFWDFLPTVSDLLQVEVPAVCDGISYLPTLTGKGRQEKHSCIYYEFFEAGGKQSIMTPDGWKLVKLQVAIPEKTYEELYNLRVDPAETTNVIKQYPQVATRLRNMMTEQRTESADFHF